MHTLGSILYITLTAIMKIKENKKKIMPDLPNQIPIDRLRERCGCGCVTHLWIPESALLEKKTR